MDEGEFPETLHLELSAARVLRYGENPHQTGALYLDSSSTRPGAARAAQLQGKELSYNNIADADAAFECVAEFDTPAAVIVKHMNPCGVSLGTTLLEAYRKALACDPVSAYGGIVAFNQEVDVPSAEELCNTFLEVVIAPSVGKEALSIFAKKPNLRLLATTAMPDPHSTDLVVKSVAGGFLVQSRDNIVIDKTAAPQVVSKRQPSDREWADMKFAFELVKHVKSNAIVYVKEAASVGIGAGQMSRIHSAHIAATKASEAGLSLEGAVMASDAFFPFPDCVEAAHAVGATAIIQPGGSKNDQASIDAANEFGIAMVFTGVRHFNH